MLNEIQVTGNKDTRSGFGDGILEAARKNPNIVALMPTGPNVVEVVDGSRSAPDTQRFTVHQRVGQIGVLQLPGAGGLGEPGVVRLPRVAEHPAGQPHGDTLGGQIMNQRVAHLGSDPAAK